ncbi:hypothetical protein DLR59_14695 [Vibrio tarriae]|nr:hypothetical protein DLR59_14695 [Vibrio tarriae]
MRRVVECQTNIAPNIPFLLEAAAVLATFVHPNHIVYLCSWGLTHLPPTCNSKLFGYRYFLPFIHKLSIWLRYASAVIRIAC